VSPQVEGVITPPSPTMKAGQLVPVGQSMSALSTWPLPGPSMPFQGPVGIGIALWSSGIHGPVHCCPARLTHVARYIWTVLLK
jgi:hypothetical protein